MLCLSVFAENWIIVKHNVLKLLLSSLECCDFTSAGQTSLSVYQENDQQQRTVRTNVPSPKLKAWLHCWNPGQWCSRVSLQSPENKQITLLPDQSHSPGSCHHTYKSGWHPKLLVREWENTKHKNISQITGPASPISYILISVGVQVSKFLLFIKLSFVCNARFCFCERWCGIVQVRSFVGSEFNVKQDWLVFVNSLLFISTSSCDVTLPRCNHGYRLLSCCGCAEKLRVEWLRLLLTCLWSSDYAFCIDVLICSLNTDSGFLYLSNNPFTSECVENSQWRLQSTWSGLSQPL